MQRRKGVRNLSDEILTRILSSTVHHSSSFNSALSMGSNSAWARSLRHKKDMILVSKRWYNICTPLLYQNIVLRRAGQLNALICTLTESLHASRIQEITVAESCHVPSDKADIFLQNLRILLPLCAKLTSFAILPLDNLIANVTHLGRLPRLTRLSLGSGIITEVKKAIIEEQYVTLLSLHIYLSPHEEVGILEFPVLEELKINIQHPSTSSKEDPAFTKSWTLPSIQRLILSFSDYTMATKYPKTIMAAIKNCGQTIQYLGIHNGPPQKLENILHACPNVTHLAMDYLPLDKFNDAVEDEDVGLVDDEDKGIGEGQDQGEEGAEGEAGEIVHENVDVDVVEYSDRNSPGLPAGQQVKILDIFERKNTWSTAKAGLDNFPSVKLVRFFEQFNHDSIFLPSATANLNSLELFKDGFSWLAPSVNLRNDILPERLFGDPSHQYQGACVYVVRRPSSYHPSGDNWGPQSLFDDLVYPLYPRNSMYPTLADEDEEEALAHWQDWRTEDFSSDDEGPGEEWNTESSMSETSYNSDDSDIFRMID